MTIDGSIISILIYILIIIAIGWGAFWLIDRMGVPNPFHWIIKLIVGLVLLVALLNVLGVMGGIRISWLDISDRTTALSALTGVAGMISGRIV